MFVKKCAIRKLEEEVRSLFTHGHVVFLTPFLFCIQPIFLAIYLSLLLNVFSHVLYLIL